MVSTPIGGIRVDLQLNSAAFIRDIAKSNAAVAQSTKSMSSSFAAVQRSVASLTLGFGALFTERFIKKLVNYNTEALKLAATLSGPLGDAARKYTEESKKFTESFQTGIAQGFLKSFGDGLANTSAELEGAIAAGRAFGSIMGEVFTAVLKVFNFISANADAIKAHIDSISGAFGALVTAAEIITFSKPGSLQPGGTTGLSFGAMHDELNKTGTPAFLAYGDAIKKSREELEKTAKTIQVEFPDVAKLQREQLLQSIQTTQQWIGVADTVGQALGTLFKENKAVAIAQAVINTAQAITEALKLPFPLNWAQVAAAGALGAAQIATIVSTNPGSSSKVTKTAKGGGATAKAGTASTRGTAGPTQTVTLNIVGDVFGPEHFRKIVAGINGVQRDGTALIQVT